MTEAMGACVKCTTEIPTRAERCPQCGFEPNVGLIGKLLSWVALMVGSTLLAIGLASFAIIFDGYSVVYGLAGFAFFGVLGLAGVGYAYNKWQYHRSSPVAESDAGPDQSAVASLQESWWEGKERGENIRERFYALPSAVFAGSIAFGVVLTFAPWVLVGSGFENAGILVLIAGMAWLGMSIVIDCERIREVHDKNPRWYFWGVLGLIPLVNWIGGLLWLWRRRVFVE